MTDRTDEAGAADDVPHPGVPGPSPAASSDPPAPRDPSDLQIHEVLRTILERESGRMQDRREELRESRSQLLGLADRLGVAGQLGVRPPPMTPPVPPERLLDLVRDLSVAVSGPLRLSIQRFPPDPGMRQQLSALLTDVPGSKRAVLPVGLLHEEGASGWLGARKLAGEVQRFTHDPIGQYLVIGEAAVLASADWGDPLSGFVMVRDPMLVAAFTALFDISYARGVPDPLSNPEEVDLDAELIGLLAEGLKDEAIARYLGISLRTVRRRVARLMEQVHAHTRFQLGLAVTSLNGGPRGPQVGSSPSHR